MVTVTNPQLNKLSRLLSPEHFQPLAVELHIERPVYMSIQSQGLDMRNAFFELFQKWKNKTGGTKHELDKALEEIECDSFIHQYDD